MPSGSMNIALNGLAEAKAQLKGASKDCEIAIKRTTSDFKSRAPAWVSKAVTATYGIAAKEVKAAMTGGKKTTGTIKVKGTVVDNVGLVYAGRALTPIHFKMKPKARPKGIKDETGRTIRRAKPYQVTAEIYKGKRKVLGSGVFLGSNGSSDIPFQRKGATRTPIEAIRTVSVPQMIENEDVAAQIRKNIDEGLTKRIEHHTEQILKKR